MEEGGGRVGGTEGAVAGHVKDAVAAKDGFPLCQKGDSGSRESDNGSGLTGAVSSSTSPSEDAAQGAGDDNNGDDDDGADYGCSFGATRAAASSSDERRHALPVSPRQQQAGGEVQESIAAGATSAGTMRAADASNDSSNCEQPPGEGRGASGEEELLARASLSGSRCWRASSRAMDISPLPGASRSSSWDSVDSELSTDGSGDGVGGVGGGGDKRGGVGARGDSGSATNGVDRTGEAQPDVEEMGGASATARPEEKMSADDFLPLFSLVLVSCCLSCCREGFFGLFAFSRGFSLCFYFALAEWSHLSWLAFSDKPPFFVDGVFAGNRCETLLGGGLRSKALSGLTWTARTKWCVVFASVIPCKLHACMFRRQIPRD